MTIELRVIGLRLAQQAGKALLLGGHGSALHDPFANLDWVDHTLSESIAASAGMIQTINPSGPIVSDMSSNTAPSPFVASASRADTWSGGGAAWSAFDRANDTGWYAASLPASLSIDMGATKTVGSFSIRSRHSFSSAYNGFPQAFTLYGSANGSTWAAIEAFTSTGWGNGELRTFTLTSAATYRHFRITVTAGSTGNAILAEAQFYPPATVLPFKLVSKGIVVHASEPVPDMVECVFLADNDAFTVKVSRDNGATWTLATVEELYENEERQFVFAAAADLSCQPNGKILRYMAEATEANRFYGVTVAGDA